MTRERGEIRAKIVLKMKKTRLVSPNLRTRADLPVRASFYATCSALP
jgi:hypothetical protein